MKKIFFLYLIISIFTSCRPELPVVPCENPTLNTLDNKDYTKGENVNPGVLIINEGGYTYGNASITAWKKNVSLKQNFFNSVNGYNIGDILQSAYINNNKDEIFLVLNNSQKIEIIDSKNFKRKRTITGFNSPRYLTQLDNYSYVTDLYANKISIFNTKDGCEMSPIKMKGWTEQIFTIDNKIYVIERSEVGSSTLFANIVEIETLVETANDSNLKHDITNRTAISIEPQSVIVDKDSNIWILSSGKESKNVFPTITKYNTSTNTIEKKMSTTSHINKPQNLTIAYDVLYYNQGIDIYKLAQEATSFPTTKHFTTIAENIYNISYSKQTGELFIFDAKDYVSEGKVFVYDQTGTLENIIQAGVIPSKIIQ